MVEFFIFKSFSLVVGGSFDIVKMFGFNNGGCSLDGVLLERCIMYFMFIDKVWGEFLRKGFEELLEDIYEIDVVSMGDDNKKVNLVICKIWFGFKIE